jgi:23S rRNA pseudouridine2604 synthase
MDKAEYPMRINKYLAHQKLCTRREADTLIEQGKVLLNGKRAVLGDKVNATDKVETRFRVKQYRYYAYNKPEGVETASPLKGMFPIGRLDKDSHGLLIITDDGRVTDALLNPEREHDKEYVVTTAEKLPNNFQRRMEAGPVIEGEKTRPCKVTLIDDKRFSVILTEGKKHQIRRMCSALGLAVRDLRRIRIMNVTLSKLPEGSHREVKGVELETFLKSIGL